MDAFNHAVGGFKFHQLALDHQLGTVVDSVASGGIDDAEAVATYEQHYAMTDERLPVVMGLCQGQAMLDHEHFSARDMSRSAIYAEWLASLGMKHTMVLMQRVEGTVQEYVGFMRHRDQRPFGDADRRLAQQLMPDLLRATRLRAQARPLARQAALGLAALDALPHGIAVVDAQCRVQHGNAAAARLLARDGSIGVRYGRLHCRDGASQARWQALVAAACAGAGPTAAGAIRPDGGLSRLVVTVLPLKAGHAAALRQVPMALVVLVDPDAPGGLTPGLLADMLGLSPTEARLALLLASGKTVKDFAAIQGCTWNTARAHLAQLLRRTGCRRQAELVGLLQSLRLG
ncbi:helix-turn-helix transcriptional regulator [Acidovorax sp. A79]|uniref:helix-turn-helix transcriptional regulator n=1 Tax=Acidovorax sp. A79 TaxID=3056107 RepID=UPI0034E8EC20